MDADINDYISQKEFYAILEDIPIPVIITEAGSRVRFANKYALDLGGYKSLSGMKCSETFCKGTTCTCPGNGTFGDQIQEQIFIGNDGREIIRVEKNTNGKF